MLVKIRILIAGHTEPVHIYQRWRCWLLSLPLYFGIRSLESHLVDLPWVSVHYKQTENTTLTNSTTPDMKTKFIHKGPHTYL